MTPAEPLTVRASSLPSYAMCPRRSAANLMWRELVDEYGLRSTLRHIGAIVGTAVHAGSASVMREFQCTGELMSPGALSAAQDEAVESIRTDTAGDWQDDDVTPDRNTAEFQAARMIETYRDHTDPVAVPALIERGLKMRIGEGLIVTGHLDRVDALAVVNGQPRDLKTGRRRPQAFAQYGGYSLLLRANSQTVRELQHVKLTGAFVEDYLPRARKSKDQPPPVSHAYPQGLIEREALSTARRMERDFQEFRRTGDPESFMCNPASFFCSERFCPAYGSTWCNAWRLKT